MRKMISKVVLFLLVFVGFPISISAYQNPVSLPDEWTDYGLGDPQIIKYNGKYYLYVNTKDSETGIKGWESTDLVSWEYMGLVATDPKTTGAYAPEVFYWNGSFYMYTSPLGQGHYILSSDDPSGPFVIRTDNLGLSIDGSISVDDDGSWYFYNSGDPNIVGHTMSNPLTINPAGEMVLPNTGGWNKWRTATLDNITLPAGTHTIKVETVNGEFDFYGFAFNKSIPTFTSIEDKLNGAINTGWKTYEVTRTQTSTNIYASENEPAKALIGDSGWTDYTIETEVMCQTGFFSSGVLVRANNPDEGGDFLQGYYVGIETDKVVLGKHNYNWTMLDSAAMVNNYNQWYDLKVTVNGNNIKVYVDDMINPKIDYTDPLAITHGKAGLRSFNSRSYYDNIRIYNQVEPFSLTDNFSVTNQ